MPEIMIPLVGTPKELEITATPRSIKVAEEVFAETGHQGRVHVGTMIEMPRAALTADEIAENAEFFSFGTNDLTQMTFGFSRDDVSRFLPTTSKQDILPNDPFQLARHRRRGPAGAHGRRARAAATKNGAQVRHLRRARRRPGVDRVLPQGRPGLRELLPVPRADRAPRRRAGGARRGERPDGLGGAGAVGLRRPVSSLTRSPGLRRPTRQRGSVRTLGGEFLEPSSLSDAMPRLSSPRLSLPRLSSHLGATQATHPRA